MNILFIDYLRAMLYLFSIYNIVNIGIAYYKVDKRLFIVHILGALLLFINFLGLVFVNLLGLEWFRDILFDYGMTTVLVFINIFAFQRLYYLFSKKNYYKKSNIFLQKISDDAKNDNNLYDILNYQ